MKNFFTWIFAAALLFFQAGSWSSDKTTDSTELKLVAGCCCSCTCVESLPAIPPARSSLPASSSHSVRTVGLVENQSFSISPPLIYPAPLPLSSCFPKAKGTISILKWNCTYLI